MANDCRLSNLSASSSQSDTPAALSRLGSRASSSLEHCRGLMEQLREGLRSFRLPNLDAEGRDRVNFEGRWCVMHACACDQWLYVQQAAHAFLSNIDPRQELRLWLSVVSELVRRWKDKQASDMGAYDAALDLLQLGGLQKKGCAGASDSAVHAYCSWFRLR